MTARRRAISSGSTVCDGNGRPSISNGALRSHDVGASGGGTWTAFAAPVAGFNPARTHFDGAGIPRGHGDSDATRQCARLSQSRRGFISRHRSHTRDNCQRNTHCNAPMTAASQTHMTVALRVSVLMWSS